MQRSLRVVLVAAIVISAALVVSAATLQSFGTTRLRVLLSVTGVGVGALLVLSQLRTPATFRRWALLGMALVAISQACFHLLVWTEWTTHAILWRSWWISLVGASASAAVLALERTTTGGDDWITRVTPRCIVVLAAGLAGLALFPEFPHTPGPIYQALLGVLAAGTLGGSLIVWRRGIRRAATPMPPGTKLAWLALSHATLLVSGFYLGRMALPAPTPYENIPSALVNLEPDALESQLTTDLERLKVVIAGVDELALAYRALDAELRQKQIDDARDYYLPEEEDRIRALFMTYLSYRSALLRIVATYAGFDVVRDENARARCFTLGYTAAMTTFKSSLQLITAHRGEVARLKLNEAERQWGIPAGMFDRIYEGVTNERNTELAMEMAAYFELERHEWRAAGVWSQADFDFLEGRILDGMAYISEHGIAGRRARLELFFDRVRQSAYTPMYAAQSIVAEWIGDTRVAGRDPMVSVSDIEAIETELQPGDILLERRNWYLSNAFLPGFWPHAALYVGRIDDLRALEIADEPLLEPFLDDYLEPASDGREHTVIESVSEGVIFNSLTESMHADYVAVLRPRLSNEEIGQAIVRAFRHHGKPYDFEFDFFTSDKLVCTELIYRAYEGMLEFDLVRVMGRDTLPALELVHKYNRELGGDDQELDFVLFLDGVPSSGISRRASEDEFMGSADRPSAFNK